MRPTMVVSSANFTMRFELCVAAQSCVNKENRRGLSTQPWVVPVLVMTVDEVWSPILTTCGLPVRKSKIHLHREVLSPRSTSFETSLEGMMVLNAEL